MITSYAKATILLCYSLIAVVTATSGCSTSLRQSGTPRLADIRGAIERVGGSEFVVRVKSGYRIPIVLDSDTRYAAQKAVGQEVCLTPGRRVAVKALLEGGRWIAREVSFAGGACLPPST